MNEPANFDTNGEKPWNWPEHRPEEPWTLKCGNSSLDDPPYPTSQFLLHYTLHSPSMGIKVL